MNITERAATVLQEIDEQLALADKATAGPWATKLSVGDYNVKVTNIWTNIVGKRIGAITHKNPDHESNAAFIAASRTVCPTALRMLKTAIERRLKCYLSNRRFLEDTALTSWQDLNELINQWNSK